MQKTFENILTPEILYNLYICENLSCASISKMFQTSNVTVRNYLLKFNIPLRPPGDYCRVLGIKHDYFKDVTDISFYLIGLITADGCVYSHNVKKITNMTMLSLQISDRLLVEFLRDQVAPESPVKTIKGSLRLTKNEFCYFARLDIHSTTICEDLENYGVVPRKTGKEYLPNIPKQHIGSYLRGLFDGDGCIHLPKNYNGIHFSLFSGCKSFLEDIKRELCFDYGNICKVGKTNGFMYYIIRKDQVYQIANLMYKDSEVALERKYNKFKYYFNKLKMEVPTPKRLIISNL